MRENNETKNDKKNTKMSTLVNAGQRRFDPGQNAAKRGPTAVPNAVNAVKAVVTSSLASPGRQTGSGRVRCGLHVPRVWPPSGSDPGSAAIGSGGPCENTRTLGFSKRPKRRRLGAIFKAPFSLFFFILFFFSLSKLCPNFSRERSSHLSLEFRPSTTSGLRSPSSAATPEP